MSEMTMTTSKGDIVFEMFDDDAPKTVGNMRELAEKGFYDGLSFHRIIRDFMIQGGCPQGTGTGGPGYEFEDEINEHKVVRGALAMANAGPNTNGSQFFIVTTDAAPWLDGKHTVFGKVTSGMDVVDALEGAADRRPRPAAGAGRDRAAELQLMTTVEQTAAEQIRVENPATGELVGRGAALTADAVPGAGRARARRAAGLGGARVRRAARRSCGARRSGWSTTPTGSRARSCPRPARRTTTRCSPRSPTSTSAFGFWAKHAPRFLADEKVRTSSPFLVGRRLVVRYRPLGVIGVIGPWNYPLTNSFGDCIPALAAGNAAVLKPSQSTPLTSLLMAEGAARVRAARRRLPRRHRRRRRPARR